MKYNKKKYNNVDVECSSYHKNEVVEHYIMLKPSKNIHFDNQIDELTKAFDLFVGDNNIKLDSVFLSKYFVSDYANQYKKIDEVIEQSEQKYKSYTASVVQQPPLDNSKVELLVYIIENTNNENTATVCRTDNELIVNRGEYQHIWNTQLISKEHTADSYTQTENVFKDFNNSIEAKSLNIKDNCIRTWLFVKDVDYNYEGVVEARKELFYKLDMTKDSHFISSTGIEGRHANHNVNVLMDAYSVGGISTDQVKFIEAPNHLNPTHEYGVTFERGTSVDYGDRRHIFISGTASIDNKGDVVHKKEIDKQIDRVFVNIAALLDDADAKMDDIAYLIVYLRDIGDRATVAKYFEENYTELPKVIVLAPVCRPEWLIEIECIAIKDIETNYNKF